MNAAIFLSSFAGGPAASFGSSIRSSNASTSTEGCLRQSQKSMKYSQMVPPHTESIIHTGHLTNSSTLVSHCGGEEPRVGEEPHWCSCGRARTNLDLQPTQKLKVEMAYPGFSFVPFF